MMTDIVPRRSSDDDEIQKVRHGRQVWQREWRDRIDDQKLNDALSVLADDHARLGADIGKLDQQRRSIGEVLGRLQGGDFADFVGDQPFPDDHAKIKVELNFPADASAVAAPLAELQGLAFAGEMIDHALHDLVRACRQQGRSWADIAEALGVTRQSAWMKYSNLENETET
jgi:hypothetical protein